MCYPFKPPLSTVAKQLIISNTLLTLVTKKFFGVLCLFSLHVLGYLCALCSMKRDQILVPEAKRGWKPSGFMPDFGYLAVVSCQGLAGS